MKKLLVAFGLMAACNMAFAQQATAMIDDLFRKSGGVEKGLAILALLNQEELPLKVKDVYVDGVSSVGKSMVYRVRLPFYKDKEHAFIAMENNGREFIREVFLEADCISPGKNHLMNKYGVQLVYKMYTSNNEFLFQVKTDKSWCDKYKKNIKSRLLPPLESQLPSMYFDTLGSKHLVVRNEHGLQLQTRFHTLYVGKQCDAMVEWSEGRRSGRWEWSPKSKTFTVYVYEGKDGVRFYNQGSPFGDDRCGER